MHRTRFLLRRGYQLAAMLLLHRRGGAEIANFYTFDSARFDEQGKRIRGSKESNFSTSTAHINLFYRFSGATPGLTRFSLAFHRASGTLYGTVDLGRAQAAKGWVSQSQQVPGGTPLPLGSYRMDLLVDGQVGDRTTITIDPSVAIGSFYLSDQAAYEEWTHAASPATPPTIDSFPAEVGQLAFFLSYEGALPGVDSYQVVLTGSEGPTATSGPHAFSAKRGSAMALVGVPDSSGFAGAFAAAELYVNGRYAASVDFTVRCGVPHKTMVSCLQERN